MLVPLPVALDDTVLGVDEEVQIEAKEDSEESLETNSKNINRDGSTVGNEMDLCEAILFPVVIDLAICDHIRCTFSQHQHNLQLFQLKILAFMLFLQFL